MGQTVQYKTCMISPDEWLSLKQSDLLELLSLKHSHLVVYTCSHMDTTRGHVEVTEASLFRQEEGNKK